MPCPRQWSPRCCDWEGTPLLHILKNPATDSPSDLHDAVVIIYAVLVHHPQIAMVLRPEYCLQCLQAAAVHLAALLEVLAGEGTDARHLCHQLVELQGIAVLQRHFPQPAAGAECRQPRTLFICPPSG
jgi:hypothetical protein